MAVIEHLTNYPEHYIQAGAQGLLIQDEVG